MNNTDEMLPFFKEYFLSVKQGKVIRFDMSGIKSMTEDAILYMLSGFDFSEKNYGHKFVSGNVLDDSECRKLLSESGFYNHVYYGGNILPH